MFCVTDKFAINQSGPRAGDVAVYKMLRDARRNLKHVMSLRTSKKHADKIKGISDSTLVAAMKWLGQPAVCRAVKEAKNEQDYHDIIGRQYAASAK
jgi:hypothetical protein